MPVQEVTSAEALARIITTKPIVLVDFYAKWCKPCMTGGPVFESVSNQLEYRHVKFVKIDIDNLDDTLKMEYGINAIPLLKLYKNNTIIDYKQGLNKTIIENILKRS